MSDEPERGNMSAAAKAILRAEKDRGAAPGKDRVRAKLDASLFGPGGGGGGGGGGKEPAAAAPSAASQAGGAGTALPVAASGVRYASHALVALAGVAIGVAMTFALRKPEVVQAPPTVVSVYVERERAPEVVSAPSLALPPPSASASTNAPASPSAATVRGADTVAEERAILDPARTALGRGDGASALDGVKRHEQKFPRGQLTEEREAIAVQALVVLHRGDEARARGGRFLAKYPNSVLAPAVKAALATAD